MSTQGTATSVLRPGQYDVLMSLKSEIMKELRVCLPGKVIAVNPDGTVNVLPSLMQTDASGTSFPYPLLLSVPVFALQGGGVSIALTPAPGDNCLVIFADRCMDSWKLNQGNPAPLPDNRTHNMSDGFAFVGFNPTPSTLPPPVPGQAGLTDGVATIAISGGKVTIKNLTQSLLTILSTLLTSLGTAFTALGSDPGLQTATKTACNSAASACSNASSSLSGLLNT